MKGLLSCVCASLVASVAWGQAPVPPADGIHDDTRMFAPASRQLLAAQILAGRQAIQADIWVTASTFLPQGQTIRSRAQEFRQQWSPAKDAVLLAYDRASDSHALSFSPGLWKRYPSAKIIDLMQESIRLMKAKNQSPEERIRQALPALLKQLQTLEKQRGRAETPLHNVDLRLAKAYALGLAGGGLVLGTIAFVLRKRDVLAAQQAFFPRVQVNPRFGASHGGGVTAEKSSP